MSIATCKPDDVRGLIRETFIAYGANPLAKEEESLLIRSNIYCGLRLSKDGMRAVWFIEEDQIKFFGRNGELLESIQPSTRVIRKAA